MEEIGIQSDSLSAILAEKKTIEGRLAKPRFMALRVGDRLSIREDVYRHGKIVSSRPAAATVVITKIDRFDSFREMLEQLGFEHFRPDDATLDHALQTYTRYYSQEDERKYGVLGLSFRLI